MHAVEGNKYEGVPVDAGHSIHGWSGQTFRRDDRSDEDAMPMNIEEVTVYTNILPAEAQNLEYGGDNPP